MKDRVAQYPHRYQLVPVAGQESTYDIVAKPGTVTEPGTPLNKANLLSDETANLYGLTGDDATVDGALATIPLGYQSALISRGNANYTDTVAAEGGVVTKNIAIGSGKKFGKCVIGPANPSVGSLIFFSTNNLDTVGIYSGSSTSGTMSIIRRRISSYLVSMQLGATYSDTFFIDELYIDGSNLQIKFRNVGTSPRSLACTIDWEVW